MSLFQFVDATDGGELVLTTSNSQSPKSLQLLTEPAVDGTLPDNPDVETDDDGQDIVYFIDDGDLIAKSSLGEIRESSPLLTVGSSGPELPEHDDGAIPPVIAGIKNTSFRLRGHSNKEKLVLTTLSRSIERLALANDGGVHRTSFQQLSQIHDEGGVRSVYERLAESDTDTHVYGMGYWTNQPEYDVAVHPEWNGRNQNAWFAVHVPPEDSLPHAALVAIETEPHTWRGIWTFDAETVRKINRHFYRTMVS